MVELINRDRVKEYFKKNVVAIDEKLSAILVGTIIRITGMKIEAIGLSASLGTLCKILISDNRAINAEVIGFSDNISYLMAVEHVDGIKPGTQVIPISTHRNARVGMELLGRVIDAEGNPIDSQGVIHTDEHYPLLTKPINPLLRKKITEPLDVGIRSINALLTISKGQRLGIFAGSGVGKSVLLGMMTHFTTAQIVVVGLVGERGREVKEFIEQNLGPEGLARSVVVAAPADTSPLMRANSAVLATTIAEYYRDKGYDVLLIIDSLTRYAQAQREIALSVGELPSTKGFTPSVFAKLAHLVERSGNGAVGQGSITAFYTVLIEGDDYNDPVADHVRSVLDGHIYLSRQLAEGGHYPAIDIERSISRVMSSVVDEKQLTYANKFKQLYSAYMQSKELINVGMYQSGADKTLDEAIYFRDSLNKFLVQAVQECSSMHESLTQLFGVFTKMQA
jgi:flagellum-specific ATP synthase